MNISSNISSISANQSILNTSANNVANVNTDGFVPSNTRISNQGNSLQASTNFATDNGSLKSQTNLNKEIPDQMISQNAVAANVSAIKTQDEMFGSLLDIKA